MTLVPRPMRFTAAALLAAASLTACSPAKEVASHPDFTGVWSGYFTTDPDPYWQIEDVACFPGCPAAVHAAMKANLDNPANRGRIQEVQAGDAAFRAQYTASLMTPEGVRRLQESAAAEADLDSYCEPYGLVRAAMNPLPFRIREEGERLLFEYEEWSQTRTIHFDDTAPPAASTSLGHSVGRYEGDALVVRTSMLTGDYYPGRQGSYSDSAVVEERYVIHENPRRLVLELTVTDPVTLVAPYIWTKTWLYTPDVELLDDSCEDVPGQP